MAKMERRLSMFVIHFNLTIFKLVLLPVFFMSTLLVLNAWAGPQGGVITNGTGLISSLDKTTTITQDSNQLIIDWDSFNLASDEVVNFNQPSSNSIVLNNILQNDASAINGQINANGKVVLINPRGLIFSGDAQIHTGDLIVSSLSVAKEEFLNGEFAFKDLDDNQGVIINSGIVRASSGITFIGESIVNNGLIKADLGYINLAAGRQAVITFDELGFMGVKVDQDVINNDLGLDHAVENNGQLSAGGSVAISAQVSSQLFDKAINNTGLVQATGFNIASLTDTPNVHFESNGDILNSGIIEASNPSFASNTLQTGRIIIEGNQVLHSGVLDVSSDAGKGGHIDIIGKQVAVIDSAIVNANGDQGGGVIRIGGSTEEGVEIAEATYIGGNALISANAGIAGSGGEVVILSENTTRYFGTTEAMGGSLSGRGGNIEISSLDQLAFDGNVDLTAVSGEVGQLSLGARSLAVINDDVSTLSDAGVDFGTAAYKGIKATKVVNLLTTSNVELRATNYVSINSKIESDSLNLLAIKSAGNLDINSDVKTSSALVLEAGDDVNEVGGIINLTVPLLLEATELTMIASELKGSGTINIVNALNIFEVDELAGFSGEVNATGPSGILIANNNYTFDLTSSNSIFRILNTEFTNFAVANVSEGTLIGLNTGNVFSIKDVQSLEVNNILFNQVSSVDGGEGVDQIMGLDDQNWLMTGSKNNVTASGMSFTNIDKAENGSVLGTASRDEIEIVGMQSIVANEIAYENISLVDTGEDVDSVSGGSSWILLADGVESSGISFISAEVMNSTNEGTLIGSNGADFFVIEDTNVVKINDMTFTDIAFVDASNGEDDIQYDSGVWQVRSDNTLILRGIDFSSIESININNSEGVTQRKLTGTESDDLFSLMDENAVSINGITYYGIGSVDARGGSDTVVNGDTWQLFESGFEVLNIDFFGAEIVDSNPQGLLIGTKDSDTFNLVTSTSGDTDILINNEITFSNIGQIDGGEEGVDGDTVISASEQEWQLLSDADFSGNQIIFTDLERATSNSSTIIGSADQDTFELTAITNTVVVNQVSFENVDFLDGQGSDDQLIMNSSNSIRIIDRDGIDRLSQSGDEFLSNLSFTDIELASIETTQDVDLTSSFKSLNIDAGNLTINTLDDVIIDSFNVKGGINIQSAGTLTFINDAEFTSKLAKLTAKSIEFKKGLKVVTNNFILDADQLFVEGGIDVDVNVERTVPADVGEDISLSIFNDINMFLASEGSIRIQDSVDSSDGFKWLISEAE